MKLFVGIISVLSLFSSLSAHAWIITCKGDGYYRNSPTKHSVVMQVFNQSGGPEAASLVVDGGGSRSWIVGSTTKITGGTLYAPTVDSTDGRIDFGLKVLDNGIGNLTLHYPPFESKNMSCLLPMGRR